MRVSPNHGWCLVSVDQGCSEFARMIDPEGGVEELLLLH